MRLFVCWSSSSVKFSTTRLLRIHFARRLLRSPDVFTTGKESQTRGHDMHSTVFFKLHLVLQAVIACEPRRSTCPRRHEGAPNTRNMFVACWSPGPRWAILRTVCGSSSALSGAFNDSHASTLSGKCWHCMALPLLFRQLQEQG